MLYVDYAKFDMKQMPGTNLVEMGCLTQLPHEISIKPEDWLDLENTLKNSLIISKKFRNTAQFWEEWPTNKFPEHLITKWPISRLLYQNPFPDFFYWLYLFSYDLNKEIYFEKSLYFSNHIWT